MKTTHCVALKGDKIEVEVGGKPFPDFTADVTVNQKGLEDLILKVHEKVKVCPGLDFGGPSAHCKGANTRKSLCCLPCTQEKKRRS